MIGGFTFFTNQTFSVLGVWLPEKLDGNKIGHAHRETNGHSRSVVYCAGVLEAAAPGICSGWVAMAAMPFLSCLAFRTSAARGWSGSITFKGCRRRGASHTQL